MLLEKLTPSVIHNQSLVVSFENQKLFNRYLISIDWFLSPLFFNKTKKKYDKDRLQNYGKHPSNFAFKNKNVDYTNFFE